MGYRCPACDTPQPDGEHLANHLAFTAMLRGGKHVAWLDEHAPDWRERTPTDLAEEVSPSVEETDHEPVTDDEPGHAHGPAHGGPVSGGSVPGGPSDETVEGVLREARELTEQMHGSEETTGG